MNGSDARQTEPTSVFEDGRETQPLAVAQRGDSRHHIGNTLAALSAAVAAGVDAIKVDVRFTRDEVPVLVSERDLIHSLG
ncbi:MAG: hypothetical protein GY906_06070, partial [bacterium]|nr:hypothetical protein [bacterium]